ncbi:MAG: hypothetical protein A2909_00010 [Candidatus Tagabacteria bacterium RIFCSPLOWO2_01_FULL_39_11]|uniref:Uncharacterized protein n=1 Tax=Candidatus Tagabacteria bacterium RIFCSPLOWO2_01_FULL_39_11 TaxID=1802295 RepID=A0A1G2LS81_9BACT|nr:MAG: hypothetical protein A2909_00010 [Candidatus Tagabacteria bacterium RIFCSPLOWO2_01_FULL_39_11]
MSQTTLEKLNTDVSYLQKEIDVLRSFVIGVIAKDKEGGYKPDFIKKVLKASQKKTNHIFKNKRIFLFKLKKI